MLHQSLNCSNLQLSCKFNDSQNVVFQVQLKKQKDIC